MSEEQSRIQINNDLPEQTPLNRQSVQENTATLLLSPQSSEVSKVLSQQSPVLSKGKYDMLKKIYEKHLEQKNTLEQSDTIFKQKSLQLDAYKSLLQQKQCEKNRNDDHQQKIAVQKQKINDLESQLHNIKSYSQRNSQNQEKIANLKAEIKIADQKMNEKQRNSQAAQVNTKINQKIQQLQQISKNLEHNKNLTQDTIKESKSKVLQSKSQLQSIQKKLLECSNNSASVANLAQLSQTQKLLHLQIESKSQQIQTTKIQLQHVTSQPCPTPVQPQGIHQLQAQISQSNQKLTQSQITQQAQKHQYNQLVDKITLTSTAIQKQKLLNKQASETGNRLEDQRAQLEKQAAQIQKVQKPVHVVPEGLQRILKRKQQLVAAVREQSSGVEKQRNRSDNLVPPVILETLREKIARMHQNNQTHSRLLSENAVLVGENDTLAARKEEMEWEVNPDIKLGEGDRHREQEKFNVLEQEVSELRKSNLQGNNRLEEYSKEYPDFNPEKKLKKQAPVVQPALTKKQSQQQDKQPKKKKNKQSSAQQIVVKDVQEQKTAPVVAPQKMKKQQPKSTKTTQNQKISPKTPQVKTNQPKSNEAKRQELPKKQDPVPKIEPKTQSSATTSDQPKKNKTKR